MTYQYEFGFHPLRKPTKFEGRTLAGAQDWLLARFEAGDMETCPCCSQTVKKYARLINATMARVLQFLGEGPATTAKIVKGLHLGGEPGVGKLSYWGLVSRDDNGVWYLTSSGEGFITGRLDAAKYAYVYNSEVIGWSAERIWFRDCTGSFDLATLLATPVREPYVEAAE